MNPVLVKAHSTFLVNEGLEQFELRLGHRDRDRERGHNLGRVLLIGVNVDLSHSSW